MADEFKGITQIIGMIPRGGKFAKSVVNFVHKAPQNWEKFKSAIKQIDDLLKQVKLKLDGKQKTNFETNKNILKTHEKVTKDAYTQYDKAVKDKKDFIDKSPQMVKDLFKKDEKVSSPSIQERMDKIMAASKRLKELEAERLAIYGKKAKDPKDPFKGWTPTVVERQNLRNIYNELDPPKTKYTKEMEAIDEELNELMLYREGKYSHLGQEQKTEILDSKLDLELSRFEKELQLLLSSQKVATASSGAVIGKGTAQNIKISTLYNAEVDKDIANYNNEIAKARNIEEANLSRIQGQVAKQRARMEQIKIVSDVGTSLLTMA